MLQQQPENLHHLHQLTKQNLLLPHAACSFQVTKIAIFFTDTLEPNKMIEAPS